MRCLIAYRSKDNDVTYIFLQKGFHIHLFTFKHSTAPYTAKFATSIWWGNFNLRDLSTLTRVHNSIIFTSMSASHLVVRAMKIRPLIIMNESLMDLNT